MFTLLDRVVIRPLAYPNANRLVHLGTLWPKVKEGEEYMLSKGQYFYFKTNSRVLTDVAMYDEDMLVVPGDAAHPAERVPEVDVSASTFRLLGIRPELGRAIGEEDERLPNGDPRYALISHGYWLRRFGGDPHVVGKRLMTGDTTSLEIIGVLPAGATIPDVNADVWIREYLNPSEPPINNHTHSAIGLLKPNVTVASALADIQRVQRRMQEQYPTVYAKGFLDRSGFAMNVTSLRDHVVGASIVRGLWLIFGAVAFVLLIAAANVANLFLVRIEARRREVAVRTALGADRTHLAIHYLTESMLLAVAAGAAAIAMAGLLLHVVLVDRAANPAASRRGRGRLARRRVLSRIGAGLRRRLWRAPARCGGAGRRVAARRWPRPHVIEVARGGAAGAGARAGCPRRRAARRRGDDGGELRQAAARAPGVRPERRRNDVHHLAARLPHGAERRDVLAFVHRAGRNDSRRAPRRRGRSTSAVGRVGLQRAHGRRDELARRVGQLHADEHRSRPATSRRWGSSSRARRRRGKRSKRAPRRPSSRPHSPSGSGRTRARLDTSSSRSTRRTPSRWSP